MQIIENGRNQYVKKLYKFVIKKEDGLKEKKITKFAIKIK